MRVELSNAECEDILAAIESALEDKRNAYARVEDQGFTPRDFGIPQLEALETRFVEFLS